MPRPVHHALCLCAALLAGGLPATPRWRLDPIHSRVVFEVGHAGFSDSIATLSGPEGELRFDPEDWTSAQVSVRLPLDRLDFGDAGWNATMLGRRWFDAARFPAVTFTSTRVEPTGENSARIHGELSVRGTSRPVVLDARLNALKRHPMTLRRTVGFTATTALDRREFGLTAYPTLIGNTVQVRIAVEATRMPAAGDDIQSSEPGDPPHEPAQRP